MKPKQSNYKQHGSEGYQVQTQHKKQFDAKCAHQNKDRCSQCGDTALIEGFHCPAKNINVAGHKFGHSTSMCFQKKEASSKPRRPKAHQLQAGTVYAKGSAIGGQSEEETSSEDSFCLQVKIKCIQAEKTEHSQANTSHYQLGLQIETPSYQKFIPES